jgi:rhodanese-related sulfurtransferase
MYKSLISILLLCFLAVSCSRNDHKQKAQNTNPTASAQQAATPKLAANVFQTLAPAQAKQLIDSRKNLFIVDVRSPQELKEGAIADSVLIPFWQILRGQQTLPKDKPLLLVCGVGGRSYAIGQVLHRKGYPEIYSLSGGIKAWKKAGLPLKY